MPKVPSWVLLALGFLIMTPVGKTAQKVKQALEDGKIDTPEFGDILAQAAKDARDLYPGAPPEEALAVGITELLATYFHEKFPAAEQG